MSDPGGRHRRPDAEPVERTEVREVWGLLLPAADIGGVYTPPRLLSRGYSDHPLTSADEVRKDFDPTIAARGTPVLLARHTTVHYDYRSTP